MAKLDRLISKAKYKGELFDIVYLYYPDKNGRWGEATIRDNQGNVIEKVKDFEIVYVIENTAKDLGKKGGEKTKEKHGASHFQKIGTLGAKKRWDKNK